MFLYAYTFFLSPYPDIKHTKLAIEPTLMVYIGKRQ